jgi:hypothetical protein
MKVHNVHERMVAATPEQIAPLIADLDRIWPTQITPAPRPQGERLYKTARMLWHEYDRLGAVRAFRVVAPTSCSSSIGSNSNASPAALSFATPSTAKPSVSTKRSGAIGSSPGTTSCWRQFSTRSRPQWPT